MKRFIFIAFLLLASLPLPAQWKKLPIIDNVAEKIVAFGVAPSPRWVFASFGSWQHWTPPFQYQWVEGYLWAYDPYANLWHGAVGDDIDFSAGDVMSFASLGRYLFAATSHVYRSTDNGYNWEALNVAGPIASNGIFLFRSSGFNVQRSADSGTTWVRMTPPRATAFGFIGPNVLATTSSDLWRSPDNGETWATVSNLPLGLPYSYAVIDSLIFGGSVGIAYSADSGATWKPLDFPHPIKALATDGKNLFAGTQDSGVWVSTDKGMSWRNVNGGAQGLGDHLKVYALIAMDSFLFVSSTRLPEGREELSYYSAMRSIPEMTGQGAVSTPPPQPGEAILIYPNPTTGIVTVVAEEILEVSALNILGKPALAARAHGTISELRLDMSKLPFGTYFLKITTKRGVTVRKIVRE